MKKTILLPIFIIIIAGIICLIFFKGSKIPKVKTIKPTISKLESFLLTTGTVEAQNQSTICAKDKGVIDKVLVEENNQVKMGQELITFDTEDALKRLEEAKSELEQAKNDLSVAETTFVKTMGLYGKQEISNQEVEINRDWYKKALLNKNRAEEEVKLAQRHLNNLVYVAPHPGVVIEKRVLPRQYVLANEVLMKIINLEKLQVGVNLSRKEAKGIKLGQDALVKAESLNKDLTGYVKDIQMKGEGYNSLTSKIIIELDPSKKLPKIGERVEVKIILQSKKNVVLLNSKAIFKEGRQSFIYLYKDGVAVKRVVRVGMGNSEQTEIIFGISPEDKVILPERLELKDGMKVRG